MSVSNQAVPARVSLLEFIKKSLGCQFTIPIYQRNYTWKVNPHVNKLLEDYTNILKNNDSSHFLGIIMYLEISKGHDFREFSIVDGQQRLVTTFLIL